MVSVQVTPNHWNAAHHLLVINYAQHLLVINYPTPQYILGSISLSSDFFHGHDHHFWEIHDPLVTWTENACFEICQVMVKLLFVCPLILTCCGTCCGSFVHHLVCLWRHSSCEIACVHFQNCIYHADLATSS